jgi:predicted NACHT family NTPase
MDYIEEYYPGAPRQDEFLQLALQKGACMILLDGLDEVGDIGDSLLQGQTLRSQVLKQVRRFAARRCSGANTNRLIITSRLEGYRSGDLPGFLEMELSSLQTLEEIETFLSRWFTAFEQETDPYLPYELALRRAKRDRVDKLMPVISGWESIHRLAMNPLLLTILAIIHEMGKRLPNRRIELYETVAKTMIENWRQAQTDHVSSLYNTLHTSDVYYLMASLAYWLHENQPGGTMPEAEWQRKIEELLTREGYKDDTTDLVARFLRHARQETGLLTERSPGQIGFFHLTLEEYLAAVEMARRETNNRTRMLEKHWPNPRWQEVILLTAGVLDMRGSNTAYKNFIASLLWMDIPNSSLAGRPVVLAGRALSDLQPRKHTTSTYRSVIQALQQTMQDLDPDTDLPSPNESIPIVTRADAADVLDELGWHPKDLYDFIQTRKILNHLSLIRHTTSLNFQSPMSNTNVL